MQEANKPEMQERIMAARTRRENIELMKYEYDYLWMKDTEKFSVRQPFCRETGVLAGYLASHTPFSYYENECYFTKSRLKELLSVRR